MNKCGLGGIIGGNQFYLFFGEVKPRFRENHRVQKF
jgi:hypothetical protein